MLQKVLSLLLRIGRGVLPLGLRKRLGPWWNDYFAWPMPLWLVRPETTITMGGHQFLFVNVRARHYIEWARRARKGIWEPEVISFLAASIRPGDTVLDVGGYVGTYAMLASRLVGDSGRVYSFEPDPAALALLQQNLRANDCHNVTVLPLALSDRVGRMALDGTGNSTSRVIVGVGSVEVTTLNRFCTAHEVRPDVMKMDIEGGEQAALVEDAALMNLAVMRVVALEVHPGVDYERIKETMRAAGKRPQPLSLGNPDHFQVAFV